MKLNKNKKVIIIAVACALVTLFQLFSVLQKKTITDDEGISYIAATGHQATFNDYRPKGTWVEASEWKKLWNPDQRFCFITIGKDIAQLDIHPPLYFWCLHVWLLSIGTSTIAGPLLNLVFFIMVFCLIVKTGDKFLNSFKLALGSAIVWGMSSSVMEYIKEARQYTLLALFTIVMIYLILTLLQSDRKFKWHLYIAISFTSLLGMLTHYYFSVLIISAFFVIGFSLQKNIRWLILFRFVIAETVAAVLFITLHPLFLASFQRQQQQAQTFMLTDVIYRIKTTITSFTSFYFPGNFSKPAFILFFIALVGIIIIFVRNKELYVHYRKKIQPEQKSLFVFFFFLTLGISMLYLGFISPAHAMKAKYLSMAHILIVFVTFILIGLMHKKHQNIVIIGMVIWQLSMGLLYMRSENIRFQKSKISDAVKTNPDRILLDNEERGVVPTVLWYFPDNTLVYAALQDSLIKNTETWIDSLNNKTIYISDLDYGNTPEKRGKINSTIRSHGYDIEKRYEVGFNSTHMVYILKKGLGNE